MSSLAGQAGQLPVTVRPQLGTRADEDSQAYDERISNLIRLSATKRRMILQGLLRVFSGLTFKEEDTVLGRSAHEYAFDTLWAITGG